MRNKLFKDFAAIMAAAVLFSNSAVISYAGEVVLDDEVAEKATNAEQKAAVKAANKALKTDTSFEYEIEPVDVNLIQNLVSAGESSYSLAKKGKNKVRYTFPVYKNGIATGKTKSKNLGKKDVSLSGTTYTFTRNFKGTIEADKLN
ncbi:hypothetical protein QYZ88_000650 [Lachnospiraceae bacterium C1.1]|nr:hypothetical protein [Lachnospiraceae bacterium C1.1]